MAVAARLARGIGVRFAYEAWVAGEARWLLGAAGVLIVLCGLPYLASAWFGPAGLEREGTFWFVRDYSQYQAAMREGGQQTGWLIHNHFSAEPHQAAFIYPLYVGAGKLAAALGLDPSVIFGALEWLGRLSLLGALYAFAATFIRVDGTARRLAVVLATGSLGLTALVAPIGAGLDAAVVHGVAEALPNAIDVYLELSSFGVFLSAPHLMLGLALTMLCGPLYLRAAIDGNRFPESVFRVTALGLAVLALALVHPFNLPVLVSVLALHALWHGRRWWPAAIVAAVASAPIAIYNLVLFTRDPFWAGTYGTQNLMPAPAAWLLPIDFGVVLLAAPLAWPVIRAWPAERRRLILLWIGLGLVWMYVPLPYQRRFAFGVQPALAVLGALGLVQLHARLRSRLVNLALAVAVASTPVLVYVALVASAATNAPAEVYLWSRAEADAGRWLGANSGADDVVLASTEFANPLAGVIDGRVVHGHIVATFDQAARAALVQQFFARDTSRAERSAILRQTGATLVAFGPRERALGAAELSTQPDLEVRYDQGGVQVWRVRR